MNISDKFKSSPNRILITRYVVVDRHGFTSYALSLDSAVAQAIEFDERCPDDKPHDVCPLGAPVPR